MVPWCHATVAELLPGVRFLQWQVLERKLRVEAAARKAAEDLVRAP